MSRLVLHGRALKILCNKCIQTIASGYEARVLHPGMIDHLCIYTPLRKCLENSFYKFIVALSKNYIIMGTKVQLNVTVDPTNIEQQLLKQFCNLHSM